MITLKNKFRKCSSLTFVMATIMIAIMLTALAQQILGSITVTITGTGKGYVILDANVSADINKSAGVRSNSFIYFSTRGLKQSATEYLINLTINSSLTIPTGLQQASHPTFTEGSSPSVENISIEMKGNYSLIAGLVSSYAEINGNATLDNSKKLTFWAEITQSGRWNESVVMISAIADFEEESLDENTLAQLRMMSIFLNAESMNNMLAQNNITNIRFSKLSITFNERNAGGTLTLQAILMLTQSPDTSDQTQVRIPPQWRELTETVNISSNCEARISLMNLGKTTGLTINATSIIKIDGNITKAAYLLHDIITQTPINDTAKLPVTKELVILPSNFKAMISIVDGPSGTSIHGQLNNIWITHYRLTGKEAEERVTQILASVMQGLKELLEPHFDINLVINGESQTSLDESIIESAKSMIISSIESAPFIPPELVKLITQHDETTGTPQSLTTTSQAAPTHTSEVHENLTSVTTYTNEGVPITNNATLVAIAGVITVALVGVALAIKKWK